MDHPVYRRSWLLLLVVSLMAVWISPARRDLWVGDETKYSRVVWESLQSGAILVPQLENEPFAHKPPIHFWMIEGLTRLTGSGSTWAFVLPSLLCFILLVFLAGQVTKRMAGASPLLGSTIFATFWLAWISAQTARMDLAFAFAISVGLVLIFEALEHDRWGLLPLSGIALGIAALVKGPMAIVIGVGVFLIEWFLRRRERADGFRLPVIAGTFFLAIAIPGIWLIAAIATKGPAFGSALILDQTLGRAFDSWVHAEPPWFYLLRFPLTFYPWFLIVALAIWQTVWRESGTERRRARYLVTWFFVVMGSFSLISSKLDVYVLPAMVPAAALAARYIQLLGHGAELPRTGSRFVTAGIGVIFAILTGAVFWGTRTEPELALLDHPAVITLLIVAVTVSVIGVVLQSRLFTSEMARTAVLGAVSMTPLLVLVTLLVPVLDEVASSRPLVESLQRTGAKPEEIGLYWTPHLWSRSMPVDYHHVRYEEAEELRANPPEVIAVRRDHAEDLGGLLDDYQRIDVVRMISKDFDVYERRK